MHARICMRHQLHQQLTYGVSCQGQALLTITHILLVTTTTLLKRETNACGLQSSRDAAYVTNSARRARQSWRAQRKAPLLEERRKWEGEGGGGGGGRSRPGP